MDRQRKHGVDQLMICYVLVCDIVLNMRRRGQGEDLHAASYSVH